MVNFRSAMQPPVILDLRKGFAEVFPSRQQDAALTCRDNLRRSQREHAGVAKRSQKSSVMRRTHCLRGVLDQGKTVFIRQFRQAGHVASPAVQVNRNDRLGSPGNSPLHVAEIESERFTGHVGEDWRGAAKRDGIGRGNEREIGNDHLVTVPDSKPQQGNRKRRRRIVHHQRVRNSEIFREFGFQLASFFAFGDEPRIHDAQNFLALLGAKHRLDL